MQLAGFHLEVNGYVLLGRTLSIHSYIFIYLLDACTGVALVCIESDLDLAYDNL